MKVLIACEESQEVCNAFRAKGHEAYSCDIQECSGGHPEWHIMQDVSPLINGNCEFWTKDKDSRGVCYHYISGKWDMIIAFPPCTHLAVSGARHFERKRADGRQREAIEFFCQFLNADCERVVIENPMGIISGGDYIKTHFPDLAEKYCLPVPYTQTVQPWWFAASENDNKNYYEKTTCLWCRGVEPLQVPSLTLHRPDRFVTTTGKSFPSWYSKTSLRGRGERRIVRSKTFPGIAKAMAEQWG